MFFPKGINFPKGIIFMCRLQWYGLDTRGFTTIIQYDTICELLLSGTCAQAVFTKAVVVRGGCVKGFHLMSLRLFVWGKKNSNP